MTKTGSTSIQHLLDTNRQALLAQGIAYPSTPAGNRHIFLATAFTSFPAMFDDAESSMWMGRAPEAAIKSYLANLDAEISALPGSVTRIILSAEQFSLYERTASDIARLHDYVMRLADRCTVIVYLRRQDEHFASFYTEFLRLGSFDEPDMDKLNDFHHNYDYAAFIARWADVFGKEHVRPRIFERNPDKRFDVIADFAEVAGFDLASLRQARNADRNQSINAAGQDVVSRLGLRMKKDAPGQSLIGPIWQRALDIVASTSPGKGWLPTRAQARAFMDRYAATNEAVRASYFPEKASLFRMDFDGMPEQTETASLQAVQAATTEALFGALTHGMAREARLCLEKADLAQRLGDAALLRNALAQAVRLDARNAKARLRFAECLVDQGNLPAAHHQLAAAAKLAPRAPDVAALRRRLMAAKQP